LSEREKVQIGIRWPLPFITISTKDKKILEAVESLKELIKSHLNVKEIKIEVNGEGVDFKGGKLSLDTNLTKKLEQEGFVRELKRRIQRLRKKAGLEKKDKINIAVISDYDIKEWKSYLKEEVGANNFEFELKEKEYKHNCKEKIKGEEFKISFTKV